MAPSNVAETPPGLRLSLAHDGRGWLAAEVRTALPDDARRVEFEVLLEGGEVATNVVLDLFVYRDDRHEWDVEASRWGAECVFLWQFALQTTHGPLTWRFDLSGAERSAHALEWGCGRVRWNSDDLEVSALERRRTWPRQLRPSHVHINLWLDGRRPPGIGTTSVGVTDVRVFDGSGRQIDSRGCDVSNGGSSTRR